MQIDDELKSNVLSRDTWLRLVLIVPLGFITSVIAMPVVWVLSGVQFVFTLVTGRPNESLGDINRNIAAWLNQIFTYMLYVKDERPFPLSDLPETEEEEPWESAPAASSEKPAETEPKKEPEEEVS